MKIMFDLELEKDGRKKSAVRVCRHCGGHLRFYRGSHSCLMCGRDIDHHCKDCLASQDSLTNPA